MACSVFIVIVLCYVVLCCVVLCVVVGGGVGLDVTPTRFVNPEVRKLLDHVTPVPQLYFTGQDSSICGVTLCQLAGVSTALRMEGLFAGVRILAQSILLGD